MSSLRLSTRALRPATMASRQMQRPFHVSTIRNYQEPFANNPKDDIGGPGGQVPRPEKPAGAPEQIKRNWVALAGGAVVVIGGMWYLTRPSSSSKMTTKGKELQVQAREKANELKHDARSKAEQAKDKMQALGDNAEDKARQLGGEALGQSRNMADRAEDKARQLGGEAVGRSKNLADQAEDKARQLGGEAVGKARELGEKAKGMGGDAEKAVGEMSGRRGGSTGFRSE